MATATDEYLVYLRKRTFPWTRARRYFQWVGDIRATPHPPRAAHPTHPTCTHTVLPCLSAPESLLYANLAGLPALGLPPTHSYTPLIRDVRLDPASSERLSCTTCRACCSRSEVRRLRKSARIASAVTLALASAAASSAASDSSSSRTRSSSGGARRKDLRPELVTR